MIRSFAADCAFRFFNPATVKPGYLETRLRRWLQLASFTGKFNRLLG
jgi:hypothetical protein